MVVGSLLVFTIGLYRYRRSLLARLFKLPPPKHTVAVTRNICVPMADGISLFTDHYFPKMAGNFPTILLRTPYGRGKEGGSAPLSEWPGQYFAERGYHVIIQGSRGCLTAAGDFTPHLNEAADGAATVDWIMAQPWFNGWLGTWGASYLGYTQWATAASRPTAIKAMLPFLSSSENFSVTHPDGAFGLETRLRWTQGIQTLNVTYTDSMWKKLGQLWRNEGEKRLQAAFMHFPLNETDAIASGQPVPFYQDLLTHPEPTSPFWQRRDHREVVAKITAPVHLIGGWYDYYLRGLLRDYTTLKKAGHSPHLTVGPWFHAHPKGMMTNMRAGLNWFEAHLKGKAAHLREKPVRLFMMGANEWREFETYPPPAHQTHYYLQSEAQLSTIPPPANSSPDHYRYDPDDPTPAVGGALLAYQSAGAQDNRTLEARPDVLTYTTPPLTQAIEVIGPVRLTLFAQSTLAYTDFFGRLCDVGPDGQSTNVCDGLYRVNSEDGTLRADGCLHLNIDMWATAYHFKVGHRLRLQVSSGAHPRWSRNPGTGEDLATATTTKQADQTIYHHQARPSALILPLVD